MHTTEPTQSNGRTSSFTDKFYDPAPPKRLSGKPLGSNLLVKRLEAEKKGLVQSATEQVSDEALVIAIGPRVEDVSVGDICVLRKFAGVGTEVRHERQDYLIVDITDVLMVVPAEV
jgi:co-chaperonin GroES (HSP10)